MPITSSPQHLRAAFESLSSARNAEGGDSEGMLELAEAFLVLSNPRNRCVGLAAYRFIDRMGTCARLIGCRKHRGGPRDSRGYILPIRGMLNGAGTII